MRSRRTFEEQTDNSLFGSLDFNKIYSAPPVEGILDTNEIQAENSTQTCV